MIRGVVATVASRTRSSWSNTDVEDLDGTIEVIQHASNYRGLLKRRLLRIPGMMQLGHLALHKLVGFGTQHSLHTVPT